MWFVSPSTDDLLKFLQDGGFYDASTFVMFRNYLRKKKFIWAFQVMIWA